MELSLFWNPHYLFYLKLKFDFNFSQDESRLARVKRALTGSLLGRRSGSNRIFGISLESTESYLDTGIPFVVYRLCTYIEIHGFQSPSIFRLSGGNPRLAERLRISFERRGDADLEGAACPSTAATILRQYLKELPQPLVPTILVSRLLQTHNRKFKFESVQFLNIIMLGIYFIYFQNLISENYSTDRESWILGTKELVSTLPVSHYRLLGYLTIYFDRYEVKHERNAGVSQVFAPVIFPHVPPATNLLCDIIQDAKIIFPDW